MTDYDHLSTLISPLIAQFESESVLIVGETAQNCYQNEHNIQTQAINSPFDIKQLSSLQSIDLAIVSDVIDTLSKSEAMQWLGTLRNRHAPHIVIISNSEASNQQGWQLSDYLALGMKQVKTTGQHHVFSYAIENYQRKKDWLNSKNWANPENYGKYRW
jgi:hypothetical protein